MRSKSLLLIKALCFTILFFGIGRFCHKQTRGFTLLKIASDSPIASDEEIVSWPLEQKNELDAIFEQSFSFLGSGGQFYAFLSADGKTVIKFFKQHHIRIWNWLSRLCVPHFLQGFLDKIVDEKRHQSPLVFESCKIAYRDFKERSGLIYMHMQKTTFLKKKLKIIDNLNIAHLIDLDSTDFVLQRHAELSHRTFRRLIQENHLNEAKQCIDSLLSLMLERNRKGIIDRDPNMRTNIGFIGSYAIEIDLGSFTKRESRTAGDLYQVDLVNKTAKIHSWLKKQNALLADYLATQVHQNSTQ